MKRFSRKIRRYYLQTPTAFCGGIASCDSPFSMGQIIRILCIYCLKSVLKVSDQIINMFRSDGETDRIRTDALIQQLRF